MEDSNFCGGLSAVNDACAEDDSGFFGEQFIPLANTCLFSASVGALILVVLSYYAFREKFESYNAVFLPALKTLLQDIPQIFVSIYSVAAQPNADIIFYVSLFASFGSIALGSLEFVYRIYCKVVEGKDLYVPHDGAKN